MKSVILTITAIAALAASQISANAVATLRLTDLSTLAQVTIVDESAGDLYKAVAGSVGTVTWTGTVGTWSVVGATTGVTKPAQGTATSPSMDTGGRFSSTGGGALRIEFSDDGFGPTPAGTFTGNVGVSASLATIQYNVYYGAALFSQANLLTSISAGGSGDFTDTEGVGALASFALSQVVTVTHGDAASSYFDADLAFSGTSVPDGGSTLLLLGSALGALGLVGWRRKN